VIFYKLDNKINFQSQSTMTSNTKPELSTIKHLIVKQEGC